MYFNKRLLAFIIDFMLFMFAFMFISMFIIYDDYFLFNEQFDKNCYIAYVVCLIIIIVLFIGKDMLKGQSLGKRIMKIKVVTIKGESPRIWQCILRNLTFFIWPIEALLLLLDKRKIGDVLAKTIVVENN